MLVDDAQPAFVIVAKRLRGSAMFVTVAGHTLAGFGNLLRVELEDVTGHRRRLSYHYHIDAADRRL